MAYMSQERKAKIAPNVKAVLNKYGIKGRLSVENHSTLILNINSGVIDFISNFNETCRKRVSYSTQQFTTVKDHISVNPYWYHEHFTGRALAFMKEVMAAMNEGNHDRSDMQSDFFDVGWYVDINIGRWDRPYALTA